MPTRRRFLQSAVAGLAATSTAAAIDPIRRPGKPHVRLSIAGYSYRKYLDLKQKPKPAMTYDDFIDNAAALDLDAVELTAY
ncbi:MAG TPA: sugar phosphate isomerase/epimerase, partial [Gemmataceae bacterium]|nr:sugar phosphate isomerase/epimerase [Gemmataceae bacterium]